MVSDDYLCGVFDGEGYITITHDDGLYGRRFTTRVLVGLQMRGGPIPDLMHARFGGSVKRYGDAGMVAWYVTGKGAAEALAVFEAGCHIKRDLAVAAMDMLALTLPQGGYAKRGPTVSDDNLEKRREVAARAVALHSAQYADS